MNGLHLSLFIGFSSGLAVYFLASYGSFLLTRNQSARSVWILSLLPALAIMAGAMALQLPSAFAQSAPPPPTASSSAIAPCNCPSHENLTPLNKTQSKVASSNTLPINQQIQFCANPQVPGTANTSVSSATPVTSPSVIDEKVLLAILALTFTLLGGIAIKIARDAVEDSKKIREEINVTYEKIQDQLGETDFRYFRLQITALASVALSRSVASKDQNGIDAFHHILKLYTAANVEEESFSPNGLSRETQVLLHCTAAQKYLSETDLYFLGKLAKKLNTNHPETAKRIYELTDKANLAKRR